jgi:hypothetical protein
MTDFEVFSTYISLKNHFTKKSYDYFKYNGKVTAKKESFLKRKDRFFFEKLSRAKKSQEIIEYFVANFIESSDSSKVWVGDLKTTGKINYDNFLKRKQALEYIFTEQLKNLTEDQHLLDVIVSDKNKHPLVLKKYLKKEICIETMIILDDLLHFGKAINEDDIIWKGVKMLMDKYRPFFVYDKSTYTKLIKQVCLIKN